MAAAKKTSIPLIIEETAGIPRKNIYARTGVPCPGGLFFPASRFIMENRFREITPVQSMAVALWPDGSIKWLIVDFPVTLRAFEKAVFRLRLLDDNDRNPDTETSICIMEDSAAIRLNTGAGLFVIPKDSLAPFGAVEIQGTEILDRDVSGITLILPDRSRAETAIDGCRIVERGPLRATIVRNGRLIDNSGKTLCHLACHQTFFPGSAACLMECAVHNPNAARHPGGVWDLGDPGSVFFKALSLSVSCRGGFDYLEWRETPAAREHRSTADSWVLYQDSSGAANWDSVNHIDGHRQPTVSFRGYKVISGSGMENGSGDQATPVLKLSTRACWVAGTIRDFWQNFPKSLEAKAGTFTFGLFPDRCRALYELQGGERKRHTLFLEFGGTEAETVIPALQARLNIYPDPSWTETTEAVPYFTLRNDPVYKDYLDSIISGPHSFFEKRNIIDEYGWRNFGDIYADHEAVRHQGPQPFIAHYNNQYDFIHAGIVHFLRTGDRRWFDLAEDLARHVADIDIYHTDRDRAAFNHGQFWHTDHYREAHTCTHRGYSACNRNNGRAYGGGPSSENNYSSGLLHYYYLTGDPFAREAVLELAEWIFGMDDGARTLFALFDDGPTGLASQTAETDFHKAGRGAGNSINTMIDAFRLTGGYRYLQKAEELIRRCVHPEDDIDALRLDDPEFRWSYLVFFQVLGKYLDLKVEHRTPDGPYFYARDSLLHYARWMAGHEKPYKELLHKVDIPTETWPAQDIRKCHVLYAAAKYAPPEEKMTFHELGGYFYRKCLEDLLGFETAYLARPLVILAAYGYLHSYFQDEKVGTVPFTRHTFDFGEPYAFVPQRSRFRRILLQNFRQSLIAARQLVGSKLPELTIEIRNRLQQRQRA